MENNSYIQMIEESINNCKDINKDTILVIDQFCYINLCKEIGRNIRKFKGYKIKVI